MALAIPQLSDDENATFARLSAKVTRSDRELVRLEKYRDGEQRLRQMGLAVPPELRDFVTIINVPGMAVREPVARQDLRGFQRSNSDEVDKDMQEAWESNNMEAQSMLAHADARTFGRAFVSVSAGDVPDSPVITVESPIGMAVETDSRRRVISAGLRRWKGDDRAEYATMWMPGERLDLRRDQGLWTLEERVVSKSAPKLVPLVMLLNRQWQGRQAGRSEMSDVIGLTDAIARMITNMQVAGEALALPHRWAAGIDPADFVDDQGNPLPVWEAYMTAIRATANENAKFGSFATADLENFNAAVNNMLAWCGAMLGLPTRYMGQQTVNPAAEGAIIADEIRLIKNVEMMNRFDGAAWSWVMGLHEFFRTGEESSGNSIRAMWFNPATPTYSQRAEAVFKMTTGARPILSREGAWDELGWSEARKAKERAYFAAELDDPTIQLANRLLEGADASASNA